ncbi:MAG TPA: putative Ig domain-containing protein [Gaiellaceae bacterium]|nr:putative Ig domain-containing protein [Gaiellaceae bacterium]
MRGVIVALVACCSAALVATAGAPARATQLREVTLIGDSVSDAIQLDSQAAGIFKEGIVADFQAAPCRRLEGEGCPVNGVRPPSAVQLIQSMGSKLGPVVVMDVGYNDPEDQYAGNIADALAALKAAGVQRVLWVNLRESRHPYITMNGDIEAAAEKNPQMSVIDWNMYSRSHLDWFQSDGIHLVHAGAVAMATLIHKTLVSDGVTSPPVYVTTRTLPLAHRGHKYTATLEAHGGIAPFGWTLLERAPAGIHLRADGLVYGSPTAKVGRYTFNVQVRDAAGFLATQRLTLRIAA